MFVCVVVVGAHRRNAWLTPFSCARWRPGSSSSSPPPPVMSARWNQRSRALRRVCVLFSTPVAEFQGARVGVKERRKGLNERALATDASGAGAESCAPSESVWIEDVDAGYAVRLDGRIMSQLDRPRGLEREQKLHERIRLRHSSSDARARHPIRCAIGHLTPRLGAPFLSLSLSRLFGILQNIRTYFICSRIRTIPRYWIRYQKFCGWNLAAVACLPCNPCRLRFVLSEKLAGSRCSDDAESLFDGIGIIDVPP